MITTALEFAKAIDKSINGDRFVADWDSPREWNEQPAHVRKEIKNLVHDTPVKIVKEWLGNCALDFPSGWWVLRLYADRIKANKISFKAAYADYNVYAFSGLIDVNDMPRHDLQADEWTASAHFTHQFSNDDRQYIASDGGFDDFVTIDLFENHVLIDRVIEH